MMAFVGAAGSRSTDELTSGYNWSRGRNSGAVTADQPSCRRCDYQGDTLWPLSLDVLPGVFLCVVCCSVVVR